MSMLFHKKIGIISGGLFLLSCCWTSVVQADWQDMYEHMEPLTHVEVSGRTHPSIWGMGVGMVIQATPVLSGRGMFVFLGSEPLDDFYTGLDVALALRIPWRISPYVGAGLFAGYSREDVPAENDRRDNDEDGFVDERGETRSNIDDVLFSVYPELGLSMVLNEELMVHVSGRYLVSSAGRDFDEWLYTIGFSFGLWP